MLVDTGTKKIISCSPARRCVATALGQIFQHQRQGQGVVESRHPLHSTANMPLDIGQQGFHTHTNNHGIKKVRD